MTFFNQPASNDLKVKKASKTKPQIDLSKGFCYHCEEPKSDIQYSYCCKGCENAELKKQTNG